MIKPKGMTIELLTKAQNDLEKRVSKTVALVNNLCSLSETCGQALLAVANVKELIEKCVRHKILSHYVKYWFRCYLGVLVCN